jgi:hypothetical protein
VRGAGWLLILSLAGCAHPPAPAPPQPMQAEPQRPRREPPLRIADLLKADPATVEAALGPPVLKRPEGEGEIWLYAQASGCSVDLVFFPGRHGARVAHATTRTPKDLSEAACLRLIADQS